MKKKSARLLFEDGSYKKFPHRAIIGDSVNFYLWKSESKFIGVSSRWIKGIEARNVLKDFNKLTTKKEKLELFDEYYNYFEKMH